LAILAGGSAHAAAPAAKDSGAGIVEEAADSMTHPQLTTDGEWAGIMVLAILGLFVCAVGAGLANLNLQEQEPPMHSHDEPPGASGHHGPGGTLDPEEPGRLRSR
jgi:hypothetical protein